VAYGQDAPAPAPADVKAEAAAVAPAAATGHGAIGFAVSTLGFDIEGAVRLASRANVRVGFNFFSLSPSFTSDGINYVAQLKLRSVVAFLDLFPFGGGFHISPGLMIHNGNQLGLNASVPGGQSFTLSGVGYTSSTTTPVTGTGQITFRTTSPALVMGWGNLIPHGSRRWSVPFEMGTVFQGTPQAILSLNGTVCNAAGAGCRTIASDPTVQANVTAEQSKVNGSIGKFKLYPIISLGFAVKF
jgi:hypothetical protein